MPEPSANGCYVLTNDGKKFPITRSLAQALDQLINSQENKTGQILIHLKNGGVSAVELKTVWVE